MNTIMNAIKKIEIKKIEATLIDAIAAVTPWLAPLIPAYLVYHNMTERLGYPPIFGLVGAAAVEFLGLSAVHTSVTFWQWNDNHKTERAPFLLALCAGLFYVVIILTVNAALDIWNVNPDEVKNVRIFSHAVLSLLSVDAAIVIAIRAQHARRLTERDMARQERKAERQAAKDTDTVSELTDKLAKESARVSELSDKLAEVSDTPRHAVITDRTKEGFLSHMQTGNGDRPASVSDIVTLYGVSERTAYRWWQEWQALTIAS